MDDVSQLLESLGLGKYAQQLQDAGYDDVEALSNLAATPGFVTAIMGDTGMRIGHARRLQMHLQEQAGQSPNRLKQADEDGTKETSEPATGLLQDSPRAEPSATASLRDRSAFQVDPGPPSNGGQAPAAVRPKGYFSLKTMAACITLVGVMSSIVLMLALHNATVSLLEKSFARIIRGEVKSDVAQEDDTGKATWIVRDALPYVEGEGMAFDKIGHRSVETVREWCAANRRCLGFAHLTGTDKFFAKKRGTGFEPSTATWKSAKNGEELWQWHYIKERAGKEAHTQSVSLYCFTLTLPFGWEVPLLAQQRAQGVGMFACDGFTIFTNSSTEFGTGKPMPVNVSLVKTSLEVPLGGRWWTALNTPTLLVVWKEVDRLGTYKDYDWTVKLDVDTVFLPERLRQLLRVRRPMSEVKSAAVEHAMYLNNCEYGLHGPIEVLSQAGVTAFLMQMSRCDDLAKQPYGEDTYLDHCLRLIGVKRVTEFSVLIEKACKSNPSPCGSAHVAFHPFKTISSYFGCWGYATKYGIAPEDAS